MADIGSDVVMDAHVFDQFLLNFERFAALRPIAREVAFASMYVHVHVQVRPTGTLVRTARPRTLEPLLRLLTRMGLHVGVQLKLQFELFAAFAALEVVLIAVHRYLVHFDL